MNTVEAKAVLKTPLFCAHEPLSVDNIKKLYIKSGEKERSDRRSKLIRKMFGELKED